MKSAAWFIGLVAAGVLAVFGYQSYGQWRSARLEKWRTDSARVADDTRAATIAAAKKDTIYLRASSAYTAHRDRVLSSGTATATDSATFKTCDQVVLTCDERHAADSVEKAKLRTELATARAKPTEKAPRLQLYADGLYDFLHAVPVFRAGAEFRVLGEIRATAVGDLTIPSALECQTGRCAPTTRALVGFRYVF